MQEITLLTIDQAARQFSRDRALLTEAVAELNDQIETLKRRALPRIKRLVADAASSHSALSNQIDAARHLFIRPRTLILHGITLGLRKAPGALDWDNDTALVALIKKHCPDQAPLLIKTTEKPQAKPLAKLDAATLKKLGVRVQDTGDQVHIKPADSEVDKLVTTLLASALTTPETTEQQAA